MSDADLQKLTPRQKEILRLLLAGFDAKSIARELDISVHTVTEHLREARRHLGVSNSREAARMLGQAEAGPPKNMGPSNIGVGEEAEPISPVARSSSNSRLVYLGATIMILLVAAALAMTVSDSAPTTQSQATAPEQVPASRSEMNPSPYPVLDVPVGQFEELKVSGAIKVFVLTGGEDQGVRLQGPRALLADAVVAVEDGKLTIRFREGARWSWNPGSGMNVVVRTPRLGSVEVDGPAQVEISRPRGDSFAATTEAAGSIEITGLDVAEVRLATNGSGSISASGSAREARYSVNGAGSIDAMRLKVNDASIEIGGAGSNYANVSGEAQIALKNRRGGRVEVVGGGVCVSRPEDTDRVECR